MGRRAGRDIMGGGKVFKEKGLWHWRLPDEIVRPLFSLSDLIYGEKICWARVSNLRPCSRRLIKLGFIH
jgi:hypothetical protein